MQLDQTYTYITSTNSRTRNNHDLPNTLYPSCLQTTMASRIFQLLMHTVPQNPLLQYSTRPSRFEVPPTSLTDCSSVQLSPVEEQNYVKTNCRILTSYTLPHAQKFNARERERVNHCDSHVPRPA